MALSFLWGPVTVLAYYVVPIWGCNIYLTTITFMQHTHVDVPHFDTDEWTWLRGALGTIDRTMGTWADAKLHHIVDSHVTHHLFSNMPFYGAKKATPHVKRYLGQYYKHIDEAPGNNWQVVKFLSFWLGFYRGIDSALEVTVSKKDNFYWFTLPARILTEHHD